MARKAKSKYHLRTDGKTLEYAVTINGKRKHFYGKTDDEIDEKVLAFKQAAARGKLFGEVLDEWNAAHEKEVRVGTQRTYKAPINDARERFGSTPIKDITAKDIKTVLSEMARKDFSIKTIKKYFTIYNSVLSYAAENAYVDSNAAANVTMPKLVKKAQTRPPAGEEDEKKIRENADKWLLPYFLLMTGMRKGEALALQFRDIDKVNKKIFVTKALAYTEGGKPYIEEPKTVAGIREIVILDELLGKLPDGPSDYFVFSGERPMGKMDFQRRWAKYQQEVGVSCTAHQLRHSFATFLYDAGVDTKEAQDILGHASEAMTKDVYTHIRNSRRQSAAAKLNAFISSQNNQP